MAMRGCGVRSAGGQVELLQLARPGPPGPGEVLLAVQAAGVGPWDALLHTGGWDVGLRPPAALGVEGAGTVAAAGPGVTRLTAGDAILVHEAPLPGGSGFWAEQVLVQAAHVAKRPAGLDLVLAGGLPVAGLTARQALDRLGVQSGTRLLITGASGPTGAVALQLAVHSGASVVATAAARHTGRLCRLGAQQVIDSHAPGWAEHAEDGFDAVLAAVRGTAAAAMSLLRDGGLLCSITSDAPPGERGISSGNLYVRPDAGQLTRLAALAADGRLELDIRDVDLAEGPATAQQVAAGRAGGRKYVLRPSASGPRNGQAAIACITENGLFSMIELIKALRGHGGKLPNPLAAKAAPPPGVLRGPGGIGSARTDSL
jgi:NADPH:quinone reductase-like Zn-dependent oxidoreductase